MSAEYEEAFVHQALVIHAARFLYDSPSVVQLGESLKTALNPYPSSLSIVGCGEDGVDQCDVQKVFFQGIVYQLLDPAYGLFIVDEETRYSLGRGLQQLLDWFDGDVSEIFMRKVEVSYDVYGKVKTFQLGEGGEDMLSRMRRGRTFKRGLLKECGERAIKMCRPEELELLVCGTTTSVVDFTALETGAQYDNGYSPSHPIIPIGVPLRGVVGLTFVIQRNGPDTERLPTSLTWFGRLLLPEYSTREKLKERLVTAIENAKGVWACLAQVLM
ncbi:hypothetical protein BJ742DRAFT_770398 [Cladochytrium replicatum]|nr:hypothetical protein BJ742DRAFT_770398 [Cladochytrium replicatum]